jgi:hypothetical protein
VNATVTIDGREVATCDLNYTMPHDVGVDLADPSLFSVETPCILSTGEFHRILQLFPPPEPRRLRIVKDGRYFAGLAGEFQETPAGFNLGPAAAGCSLCGQGRLYSSTGRALRALANRWAGHRCPRGSR